jgi:hypothetical protein
MEANTGIANAKDFAFTGFDDPMVNTPEHKAYVLAYNHVYQLSLEVEKAVGPVPIGFRYYDDTCSEFESENEFVCVDYASLVYLKWTHL